MVSPRGQVVGSISGDPIDGPWDMTSVRTGPITTLFVTNVLNGTVAAIPMTVDGGTVVRIRLLTVNGLPPIPFSEQVIASGFAERTDSAAPGVGLGRDGTLYVADSVNSAIAVVPNAMFRTSPAMGGGTSISSGRDLNDPLGLTIAPNGDILSANGADGNLVETTPAGQQVAETLIDDNNGNGAGDLFGLAVPPSDNGVLFVDDFDNTLRLLH
jgi:hypothetical protein